jgi:hypothetical protein
MCTQADPLRSLATRAYRITASWSGSVWAASCSWRDPGRSDGKPSKANQGRQGNPEADDLGAADAAYD